MNSNFDSCQRLLTQRQAAHYLGCCEKTIFNMVKSGELKVVRLRGVPRYDVNDLNDFIDSSKVGNEKSNG